MRPCIICGEPVVAYHTLAWGNRIPIFRLNSWTVQDVNALQAEIHAYRKSMKSTRSDRIAIDFGFGSCFHLGPCLFWEAYKEIRERSREYVKFPYYHAGCPAGLRGIECTDCKVVISGHRKSGKQGTCRPEQRRLSIQGKGGYATAGQLQSDLARFEPVVRSTPSDCTNDADPEGDPLAMQPASMPFESCSLQNDEYCFECYLLYLDLPEIDLDVVQDLAAEPREDPAPDDQRPLEGPDLHADQAILGDEEANVVLHSVHNWDDNSLGGFLSGPEALVRLPSPSATQKRADPHQAIPNDEEGKVPQWMLELNNINTSGFPRGPDAANHKRLPSQSAATQKRAQTLSGEDEEADMLQWLVDWCDGSPRGLPGGPHTNHERSHPSNQKRARTESL